MTVSIADRPTAPMTAAEFDALYDQLKNWDLWEDSDRGAWNRLTPAHTAAAAAGVRTGRAVTMSLPWAVDAALDNPRPAQHFMVDLGDREAPEPSTNKDYLGIEFHGKACTHLDALSHIAYRGELFGGKSSRDSVGAVGAQVGTVSALGGFVGRGILLDMPKAAGVDWLEPGRAIYADDILAAEAALGVAITEADAVLVRTGHKRRHDQLGAWDSSDLSSGLHATAMPLLAERHIAMLGSDGDSDVRPSPTPGIHSPIHILAITAMGVPLLDNLDLENLAVACAQEERYDFLLTVAPLNVPHGTGSPVTPIAVF